MAPNFLSSPDSSDIDAIIAEATDLCALEQIAALNTAHLSDSYLPSNLETRFRKLKTFPATNNHPSPTTPPHPPPQCLNIEEEEEKENITATPTADPKPDQETESVKKPKPASVSPHPPPSPPPRQACCFGFSPKKIQRRKSNADVGDVGELDDIFAEFGSSSMKEHRRRLKKAWKEQEKATREAEKMAKWVKQVSIRIREASLDDLLDDDFK